MSTHYFSPTTLRFRRHRWEAISPIAIDVTVPWSVFLSVCHVQALCSNSKRNRHDFFCIYISPISLEIVLIFGLHRSTPSFPTVASVDLSVGDIGNHHCSFEWYHRWPLLPPFLPNGVPKCTPRDQLAGEYDRRYRSAMLPFVKLFWP